MVCKSGRELIFQFCFHKDAKIFLKLTWKFKQFSYVFVAP